MRSILLALLALCAGATAAAAQVLVTQPIVADVRTIARVNDNPPKGTAGVTLWGACCALWPTNAGMGQWTGFWTGQQLSTAPTWPEATGIQAQGGQIGINIHSASIKPSERFGLGTIVLGTNLATPARPFAAGKRLRYSFDVMIPWARQQNGGVTQVVAYYSFRNIVSGQAFWYGLRLYDSRGWPHVSAADSAKWDQGTGRPIVHATAGAASPLVDRSYATANFKPAPFNYWQSYAFTVGPPQLEAAVAMLIARYPALADKLVGKATDYELRHINLNPETHTPPGAYAHIGMAVRNWRLEVTP